MGRCQDHRAGAAESPSCSAILASPRKDLSYYFFSGVADAGLSDGMTFPSLNVFSE
jgi:hypothetical protein